jgi:anti-sigma B factor antagonist
VPLLELDVVADAGGVVVRLSGEADLSTAEQLAAGLRAAAGHDSGAVLLDGSGLRYCDLSAVRTMTAFAAELRSSGRHCRLVAASARVRRLLQLAGLTDLLDGAAAPA